MNFGQARGFSSTHHHIQALSLEDIALASLVCDDTVTPVEPDGARSCFGERRSSG